MIDYWNKYSDKLIQLTIQHLQLVGVSVSIAFIIASLVIFFCLYNNRLLESMVYFFSLIYAVPSLAMFALLIPLTGLGKSTAIVTLVIYSQYIFLRNFVTGIKEIDPVIVEAAFAMGMTKNQVFRKIQLPLATRAILAAIRIAATSTVGIATIAATINAGGLGVILFDGLRTLNLVKLSWGTILIVLLCLLINLVIGCLEFVVSFEKE